MRFLTAASVAKNQATCQRRWGWIERSKECSSEFSKELSSIPMAFRAEFPQRTSCGKLRCLSLLHGVAPLVTRASARSPRQGYLGCKCYQMVSPLDSTWLNDCSKQFMESYDGLYKILWRVHRFMEAYHLLAQDGTLLVIETFSCSASLRFHKVALDIFRP